MVVFGTDVDGVGVRSCDERVERASLQRWTVGSQPLGGGAGDGDPERFASGQLLGSGGGVDHYTLPRPCWPDEHGGALGTCQDEQRHLLFVAEWDADALCDLTRRVRPRRMADISSGGLGECRGSPFDRLLLRTHRERRHPSALQREHAPVADHLACDLQRFMRC
jgi:hypothetical protein